MISWIFRLYIGILIIAPLSLGAREPSILFMLEILCFSGLALYVLASLKESAPFYRVPGIMPLGLMIFFMIVQAVPWPAAVVRLISPSAYDVYSRTLGVTGPFRFITLSLDVKATILETLRFSAYASFYILTVQLLSDGSRLKKTVRILASLGAVVSVYALSERFFSNGKIYWLFSIPPGNNHVGPYVYKNHYAGFVEMVFPLVFAAFHYYRPRFTYGSFRERLFETLTRPHADAHILFGFVALLMATSQFVSLSRGGIICLSASVVFFIVVSRLRSRAASTRTGRSHALPLYFFLVVLSVSWFGWDSVFQRFEDSVNQGITRMNGRQIFWTDSLEIIKDYPLAGSGFGSFGAVYPGYRTFPGNQIVDHAHSDALELAATGGIAGVVLMSFFLISVLLGSLIHYVKRRDSWAVAMATGAMSGGLAILLHSMTDFNYFSNANGLYMFFLAGFLVAASGARFRSNGPPLAGLMKPFPVRTLGAFAVVFMAVSLWINPGILNGRHAFSALDGVVIDAGTTRKTLDNLGLKALEAVRADPLEGRYALALAMVHDRAGQAEAAEMLYRKALRLKPAHGETAQKAGRFYLARGIGDQGAKLMTASLALSKSDVELRRHGASFLLHAGRRDEGFDVLKTTVALDPGPFSVKVAAAIMADAGIPENLYEQAMPQSTRALYHLADYFESTGHAHRAIQLEAKALDLLNREHPVETWMITRPYRKRLAQGDAEGALDVLRAGLQYLPDDPELLCLAAAMYEKMGIIHKSHELYNKIQVVDPMNPCQKNPSAPFPKGNR